MYGLLEHSGFFVAVSTWRFMGSYKWSYMSPNFGYAYSYPISKHTFNCPCHEPPNIGYTYSYPIYKPTYNCP